MPINLDFKFIVSIAAIALTIYSYFPYVKDIFLRKTTPHMYTWLVWAITQGTAAAGMWHGGGNYAIFSYVIGTILVVLVFFLSFRYGTRNIKKIDAIILTTALSAILIWWGTDNPLLAVALVSVIDFLGYVPTFRKSFEEPWSETLSFWLIMAVINILVLISIAEYNFLTVVYPITLGIANVIVWAICFFRRKRVAVL